MMSEFDETDHAYQMYAMFCDNDIDFEKRYKSKILKKGNSRLRRNFVIEVQPIDCHSN